MRQPSDVLPVEVAQLLGAKDSADRDDAWELVVARYSQLILRVTHAVLQPRDDRMDAYAYVLDQLHADDYRRIRAYAADGRCKFTTWLVVVARRACIDFARQKYGRRSEKNGSSETEQETFRRQLAREIGSGAALEALPDENGARPDGATRGRELALILDEALAVLPLEDRVLLKLRFTDDLPASEIAKLLRWPSPFHVYRRLNSVFAALRGTLASRGVVESTP